MDVGRGKRRCTKSESHGFALEAGEVRAQHELHSRDELGSVWTRDEESGDAELLEDGMALQVAPARLLEQPFRDSA
jgi:hypothetical protein